MGHCTKNNAFFLTYTFFSPAAKNDCGCLHDDPLSTSDQFAEIERLERLLVEAEEPIDMDIAEEVNVAYADIANDTIEDCTLNLMEDVSRKMGNTDAFLKREYDRKKRLMNPYRNPLTDALHDHQYTDFSWNKRYFTDADLAMMENHQSDILPINQIVKNYPWFKLIPNTTHPEHSHMKCGLCAEHSSTARIKIGDMDLISLPKGVLYANKNLNLKALRDHAHQSQHLTVTQLLKNTAKKAIEDDEYPFEMAASGSGTSNDEDENTAKLIRTAYQTAKVCELSLSQKIHALK